MQWDVAIVGAGPAGSICAAFCAKLGLKTLLLDRSSFPRDKVCGDCVNPAAWDILNRLEWQDRIRALPSRTPEIVEFVSISGRSVIIPLAKSKTPEIVIRRREFDQSLVECAVAQGVTFRDGCVVKKIEGDWKITTESEIFQAKILIAADGRNSTVCRLLGLLANTVVDRVAIQAHIPRPPSLDRRIRMSLTVNGYAGLADLSEDSANLCIVSRPQDIVPARKQMEEILNLPADTIWRSIVPLTRAPIISKIDQFFVIGDAARVVEPFTGEGIYYAMRSGEIAASAVAKGCHSGNWKLADSEYRREHSAIYAKRIWINQVARFFCMHPKLGSKLVDTAPFRKSLLSALTTKVCGNIA
ncbi:MAG: NAD(P)/FAD-dependent oxidoreductase [Chthoniobacterales bacterium]